MVELLQTGQQTLANPTVGRMDTPPHAQMFLAALAQQEGAAQCLAKARGKAPPPQSGEQLTRRMADSEQPSFAHRPEQCHHRRYGCVYHRNSRLHKLLDSTAVAENRITGGVGEVAGAIPSPRPDRI